MTALANARVDVMTALVSFERVFEVLDLPPMITERPDARIDPATNAVVSRIHVPYAPQDLIAAYGSLWVTLTTDPK